MDLELPNQVLLSILSSVADSVLFRSAPSSGSRCKNGILRVFLNLLYASKQALVILFSLDLVSIAKNDFKKKLSLFSFFNI